MNIHGFYIRPDELPDDVREWVEEFARQQQEEGEIHGIRGDQLPPNVQRYFASRPEIRAAFDALCASRRERAAEAMRNAIRKYVAKAAYSLSPGDERIGELQELGEQLSALFADLIEEDGDWRKLEETTAGRLFAGVVAGITGGMFGDETKTEEEEDDEEA